MNRGDAQRELFQASRTLNKARAAVLDAGPDAPMEAREQLMREYNAATHGLLTAAVTYAGAYMREKLADPMSCFDALSDREWFEIVDGIPSVKERR